MKFYISHFNGVLSDLKQRLAGKLADPRDADCWIVWQDIRGSYGQLIKMQKELGFNKKVFCVQHGGAATRDYGPPNNMVLQADRFLCWGSSDYDRLRSLGLADRARIVGCPLNTWILPKVPHNEKLILFIPVNTGKEEPENIEAYYELIKAKYKNAQIIVASNRPGLKDTWGFQGRNKIQFKELSQNFDVIAKLLPSHQQDLYHGGTILGYQDDPNNNKKLFNLLRNVDCVVGLDEGTSELFAYGHDIPVVVVEGFKYRQYDLSGRQYSSMDTYRTKASTRVPLSDLSDAVEYAISHPEYKREERREVAEAELGISLGDPNTNILKEVKQCFKDLK